MKGKQWEYYYEAPDDLYRVMSNPFELAIMTYLIQLGSGLDKIHPSEETLRLGLMSKMSVKEAKKSLRDKGFISWKATIPSKLSCEYTIHYDAIRLAILKSIDNNTLGGRAKREMTEAAKDSYATRRVISKPHLTRKVIAIATSQGVKNG